MLFNIIIYKKIKKKNIFLNINYESIYIYIYVDNQISFIFIKVLIYILYHK